MFLVANTILKLSFWKPYLILLMGLILGGFVMYAYPYAVEESPVRLNENLNDPAILQNLSALITLEAIAYTGFCFLALQEMFHGKGSRWYPVLKYYPGLLIFPVLYFLLVQAFFYFPGAEFMKVTIYVALTVIVIIPGLALLLRNFVKETDLRLEIHFLVSALVVVLGLISVNRGRIVYRSQAESMDWMALSRTLGLFLILAVFGYFLYRIRWVYRNRKENN